MAKKVSTKKILDRSIEDIRKGGWLCGELVCIRSSVGAGITHQACAVGLITAHSEVGRTAYPAVLANDGELPGAVKKALKALYTTVPAKALKQYYDEVPAQPTVGEMEGIVVAFNDGIDGFSTLTERKALNWFKRARASLDPVA